MAALSLSELLQSSNILIVCDSPRGHKSNFAPSALCRRRDGSPSPRSKSINTPLYPPISRWDSSSSCSSSPVKPDRPKIGASSVVSVKELCSSPCSLQNVLKPVRRLSMDVEFREILTQANGSMNTAKILADALDNLSLLPDDVDDNVLFWSTPKQSEHSIALKRASPILLFQHPAWYFIVTSPPMHRLSRCTGDCVTYFVCPGKSIISIFCCWFANSKENIETLCKTNCHLPSFLFVKYFFFVIHIGLELSYVRQCCHGFGCKRCFQELLPCPSTWLFLWEWAERPKWSWWPRSSFSATWNEIWIFWILHHCWLVFLHFKCFWSV